MGCKKVQKYVVMMILGYGLSFALSSYDEAEEVTLAPTQQAENAALGKTYTQMLFCGILGIICLTLTWMVVADKCRERRRRTEQEQSSHHTLFSVIDEDSALESGPIIHASIPVYPLRPQAIKKGGISTATNLSDFIAEDIEPASEVFEGIKGKKQQHQKKSNTMKEKQKADNLSSRLLHWVTRRLFGNDGECKICYDHDISVAFIPCGHMVACLACAQVVKDCPVCRGKLEAIQQVFKVATHQTTTEPTPIKSKQNYSVPSSLNYSNPNHSNWDSGDIWSSADDDNNTTIISTGSIKIESSSSFRCARKQPGVYSKNVYFGREGTGSGHCCTDCCREAGCSSLSTTSIIKKSTTWSILINKRMREPYFASSSSCKQEDEQQGKAEEKEESRVSPKLLCTLCQHRLLNCVLVPCGHAYMCFTCAQQVQCCAECGEDQIFQRQEIFPV